MRKWWLFCAIALSTSSVAQQPSSSESVDRAAQREVEWMSAVVQRLSASLIDPSSARISLPYGFTPQATTWKVWGVDMTGYFTCGTVNSRNRIGGYVGETVFLAHISPQGQVSTMLDSSRSPILGSLCARGGLPPIRPATTAAIFRPASRSQNASLAQDLENLSRLRQQGDLSEAEFAAAKERILGRN